MIVQLDNRRLQTVEEIREFCLESTFDFEPQSREATDDWIRDSLRQLRYRSLGKADRGLSRPISRRDLRIKICKDVET